MVVERTLLTLGQVYGEVHQDGSDLVEQSILNPSNPYAASKAGAEHLVHSYGKWVQSIRERSQALTARYQVLWISGNHCEAKQVSRVLLVTRESRS